ncbi:MAG: spore coat protein U domain-containing protein [Terracidiphilus sp.]
MIKPAAAATASASFSVSATVQASCVAAVTPSALETHASESDATPAVAVSCSNSVPYKITLNAGAAGNPTIAFPLRSGPQFPMLSVAPRTFSGRSANPIFIVVTY